MDSYKKRYDIHVYERYKNEAAVRVHLAVWCEIGPLFTDVVDISQVTVFSHMYLELESVFAGSATVFMSPNGCFVRWPAGAKSLDTEGLYEWGMHLNNSMKRMKAEIPQELRYFSD